MISRSFVSILAAATFAIGLLNAYRANGQVKQSEPISSFSVDVVDLSAKFLAFYDAATRTNANPEQRWILWKEKYDFAAVPPIAAGQKIAREHLDAAWAQYPQALPRIRLGAAALVPSPRSRLEEVANLLGAKTSVRVRLIAFVGTFNHDSFSAGLKNGVNTIAIPLEDSDQDHALGMTHEFTHAVQMQAGHWDHEDVASSVFAEGLAMHVTQRLNPGLPTEAYLSSTREWLDKCTAKLPLVLKDLQNHLGDSGADSVSNFTYGQGASGLNREVYCGGWFVVGDMLKSGQTFEHLGNLDQDAAGEAVHRAIQELLTANESSTTLAQHVDGTRD